MAENRVTLEIDIDSKDAIAAIELFGKDVKRVIQQTEKVIDGVDEGVKDAKESLKGFSKDSKKSLNDVEKSFESTGDSADEFSTGIGALRSNFGLIAGVIATTVGLFKGLEASIKEATSEAKELKQIKFALQATGEASAVAVQDITDFTFAIRQATSIDDGFINQLFIQAKAFGTSTEQAKKLTKAAVDLSAATGQDAETALRQLGGTLDGSAGKINLLGVEFRNLSSEQLKNGAAIDLVNKKYGGAAAAELDTYQGSVNKITNSIRDLQTEIGKGFTESGATSRFFDDIAAGVDLVTGAIQKIGRNESGVKKFEEFRRKQLDLIELVGNKSEAAAPKVKTLIETLASTGGKSSSDQFKTFGETLDRLAVKSVESSGLTGRAAEESRKRFEELQKTLVNVGQDEISIAQRIRDERLKILDQTKADDTATQQEIQAERVKTINDYNKAIEKQFDDIEKLTEDFSNTVEKEAIKASKALEKIGKAESLGVIGVEKAIKIREKILADYNEKRIKEAEETAKKEVEIAKKAAEDSRNAIQSFASDPTKIIFNSDELDKAGVSFGQGLAASIAGALNSALDGKSGATKFVSSIGGKIFDSFLPGIGPVVSSIFEKLAAGKEQAKAFVSEFISSIPEIMEAIIEAIPAVVEAFIEVLGKPSFWIALGRALAKGFILTLLSLTFGPLGTFLFEKAGEFGARVGDLIAERAQIIADKISAGFNNFFAVFDGAIRPIADIFTAFGDTMTGVFENTASAFNSVSDKISNTFGAFSNILTSITNGLSNLFEPLVNALVSLERAVSSAGSVGGKGGGSGIISETADRIGLKFADGGIVPNVASGIDRVPALVTPGELVIPTDLVGSLASFLSNQGNTSGGQDTAVLMAILQAVQQPITVQAEAKVNQNAFADILLQLNRQNARTVA